MSTVTAAYSEKELVTLKNEKTAVAECATAQAEPFRIQEGIFISVVIPALNEAKSIGSVLCTISRDAVSEVVVVDNGSEDRTASIARNNYAKVVKENERGYGAACLKGIDTVSEEAEIIVFLDADFSDYPEDLGKIVEPLLNDEADMVIGSRTRLASSVKALAPQQRFGNWLATRLIQLFWGHQYSDLGPFRAIKRKSLDELNMVDRDYGWTVEMQIKAIKQKLRVQEVPVRYRIRIGRSKISGTVKGTVLAGSKILYTIFRYMLK